jgi:hypothetical protein
MFIQSLIRISVSREKDSYMCYLTNINNFCEDDKELDNPVKLKSKESSVNYSIRFIEHIVGKCFSISKSNFGDNYTCLFRKEEIYADIIKSYFSMFGNSLLLKVFGKIKLILKYLVDLTQILNASEKKEKYLMNINNFLTYFDKMLNILACSTPNIIKLLLKVLFDKIREFFTVDSNTNYFPIFTLFFFNFLISPRIQEIYGVSPVKFESVRILNRVLRVRDMF